MTPSPAPTRDAECLESLERALRVLLTPLDAPSLAAWRLEAHAAIVRLLGAAPDADAMDALDAAARDDDARRRRRAGALLPAFRAGLGLWERAGVRRDTLA
ncbi:hypothetical protein PYV61_15010, partial [Roseisolibacter sp. H3M3-2]